MHPIPTRVALCAALLATRASLPAAEVPTNPSGVTVLSPFEVTGEKDVGYQAGNTLSGSRLNSSLKDTAAAVMVFTPEFLSDFGATSLADLIGYALSTWFNVTKNLTAVVNLSYTKTDRSSVVPEFEGWFERENTFWHRTAGAGSLVNSASGSTIDQEAASLQRVMEGIREFYNFGYGERPYKANASGRYSFTEGTLRGAFAGAGVRWQGTSKLGRALLGRAPNGNRVFGETFYGPEDFKLDAFAGYRRRVSVGRFNPDLTVQLNVTNLTDEDVVMPLRYNSHKSGYTRVLLFEPRKLRLTVGVAF